MSHIRSSEVAISRVKAESDCTIMDTKSPLLVDLTEKQQEVLDRVLDHKSSKQIARELNISPHTVEQRIKAARLKFGAPSRAALAVMYRSQKVLYDELVYQSSDIAAEGALVPVIGTNEAPLEDYVIARDRWKSVNANAQPVDKRLVPKVLDGPYGTVMRLGLVLAFAIMFLVIGLAGLAMFSQLSRLFGA